MFEVLTTDEFDRWLSDLADERARTKIASRVARLRFGNAGDAKPVGERVSEMRVHHGPGYRVYYKQTNKDDHRHAVRGRQVDSRERRQASEENGC
jgi:putative addiction module killer protein